MRLQMKRLLAGSMVVAGATLIGCASHSEGPYYGSEPVQSGYAEYPSDYAVAEDPYYDRGAYSGDYWVWHDREGHEQREARAAHEQRARAYEQQRNEQFNRGDRGETRNEGNRGAESGAHGYRGAEGQSAGHAEMGRGGAPDHSGAEGRSTDHGEAGRGGPSEHPGAEGHGGNAGIQSHGESGAGHGDADGAHR